MARKQQKRAKDTRDKIVSAAIQIFSREGFARGSFQAIADKCKISQAAVLHHFPNKEVLFSAVIDRIAQHNYQLVGEAFSISDTAYTKLVKYFHVNLIWGHKFPEEGQILLLLYYFATVDKRFSSTYYGLLLNARNRLHGIVLAGERERLFHLNIKSSQVAEILHDTLLGLFVNFLAIVRAKGMSNFQSELRTLEAKWKNQINLLTGYIN